MNDFQKWEGFQYIWTVNASNQKPQNLHRISAIFKRRWLLLHISKVCSFKTNPGFSIITFLKNKMYYLNELVILK